MDNDIDNEFSKDIDFSTNFLNDSLFKTKFKILTIIKTEKNRASLIVSDNDIGICFLKILNEKVFDINVYNMLLKNPHINIITIYDIIKKDNLYYVVEEYIPGKNLAECTNKMLMSNINTIVDQLISGIKHLHNLDIIHGDMKLENVMYYDSRIKIVDFDFSKISNSEYIVVNSTYGTENYIAPESFDLGMYSKKTDLWSLGVLLYKMITNKFPYVDKPNKLKHFYIKNNFKHLDLCELDKYKNTCGIKIINAVKRLLQFNDSKRNLESPNT